jgi:hypothetical protein
MNHNLFANSFLIVGQWTNTPQQEMGAWAPQPPPTPVPEAVVEEQVPVKQAEEEQVQSDDNSDISHLLVLTIFIGTQIWSTAEMTSMVRSTQLCGVSRMKWVRKCQWG